ncbi:MAG TPA: pitrilysin family protein [Vicinamibacterales bacterium]|nr:pitrilysin family protein [Vicinamibacterales bacterium]
MIHPRRLLLLVPLALSLAACGQTSAPATSSTASSSATPDTPSLQFEKYALANGLEVIVSEDHRLPLVAVDLWYHVGPANEAAGRTGFAHLFEHMMFQGSKHVPGDSHFRLLEAAGGTNLNGTTDFDRTNYFETLPANQLELGLWLESDRMGYLLDELDQAKLSNQQDVVRNERRQSVENEPYGVVDEAVYHNLFPQGHPYYADVIGSHADIQAAKLEDVKGFFKQYYTPNNASLAIVGDVDKAQVKTLVEKYFGTLKRGPDVPKVTVQTPPITSERKVVVKDHVQLPRVYMTWLTPSYFAPGDADADIAAGILGGGHSSRLYKALVYDKQIAQDVSAAQQSLSLSSVFRISATARPGHTAEELTAAIDEQLKALTSSGPDAKEVERARNVFETSLLSGLQVLGGFGGVADTLNLYNHYVKNPGYLGEDLTRHRAVTAASVKTFVQTSLKPSARVVVFGVPGDPDLGAQVPTPPAPKVAPGTGAEAVNADEAWRKDQPKPAAQRPITLPTPQSFQLPNGLTVLHYERPGMPVVAASLVIRTGGDSNPTDRAGLANFTGAMLDQGTASRDALTIADDVAHLGASLSTASAKDASFVTVQSLRKNFGAALDLLADVALHPSFPDKEIDRERASRLGQLIQSRQDPNAVAQTVAVRVLYGDNHPYGYIELGTESSIQATKRDDLAGFWKQNFVPNNAALVVAGPISQADVKALAEKAFGSWAKGTPAAGATDTFISAPVRLVLVDRPGAEQTQLRVAEIGAPRSVSDYAALNVMNLILGGLFSSRINLNLREAHGYTYGAFSQFIFRKHAGPFWVGSGVRTNVTAPAVAEIMKELKRMTDTTVTPDELNMGRDSLTRSLPADFETSASAVDSLSGLYIYNLGLDYYSTFPAAVSTVTAEAVQAAAKKYLHPDKIIVIAVGDRKKIEADLRKLNLGAVEIRSVDGSVRR